MAVRVVSLMGKPKVDGPTSHFVRLSRGENGAGFIVGYVDHTGTEDFRSQAEFSSYDQALAEARSRAHSVRRPLRDDTGVEPAEPKPPAHTPSKAKAAPCAKRKTAEQWGKALDELPSPFDGFRLPPLSSDALKAFEDADGRRDFAFTLFRERRALAIETHEQSYGDSRDHLVSYTQKTHDQIQWQIYQVYAALQDERAALLAYLEAAFDRIEQLERSPRGMNYRGVFKQDEEYALGDVCTWGGSAWHCNEPTGEKPGEGSAWTLMVKRGRDGKDATKNAA